MQEDENNLEEYEAQQPYFTRTIWNSIFQSILVSTTGVATTTALIAILIVILLKNSQRIVNMIMPYVIKKLFGLNFAFGDDEEEYSDSEGIGCFPHQLTPAPRKIPQLGNKTDGHPIDMTQFNPHEMQILELLIQPDQLNISWENIAGSRTLIKSIKEQVIFPVRYAMQHSPDPLLMPPKGVLLYGPPGCGKTMIAKALSNEINAHFINFDISLVMQKWVGETEKMASALFTAARKLDPCIIFIDEIDSFLSQRDDGDHSTQSTLKAIFLQQWDGLTTDSQNQIIVLAASNRIDSIDDAILRRLPLQFCVPLPTEEERLEILKVILKDCDLDYDVNLSVIANKSEAFSGSDLQEVCRHAATYRLVEFYKKMKAEENSIGIKNQDMMDCLSEEKQQLVDPADIFHKIDQIQDHDFFLESLNKVDSAQSSNYCQSNDSETSCFLSSIDSHELAMDLIIRLLNNEFGNLDSDEYWEDMEQDNQPIFQQKEECSLQDSPHSNIEEKLETQLQQQNTIQDKKPDREQKLRAISMNDLIRALKHSRKSNDNDFPRHMYN